MRKNKYRAAVIGCGRIGSEFDSDPKRKYVSTHAGAYSTIPEAGLVAVCDVDKGKSAKCAERWKVPAVYTDVKKMLKKENLDVVSICTPPKTHYQVLKEIVKWPVKAVFCEKPLAGSLEEAEKMIALCKKKRVILQVDHQRRFDSLHQELKKFIDKRKFGDIQQVNFYYTAGIGNTGSHMFDLLRMFFGDVKWIEAFDSKNKSPNSKDPNLDGMIKFKSGVLGTFQACDVKKYLMFEMNCLFEKGKVVLKNSGFDIEFFVVKDSKYFSGYKELFKGEKTFKTGYKRNFMVNAVKHLLVCVKRKTDSVSSGYDGFKAQELIEKSLVSAKNSGKRIFLK
ncbi:MAG: Gfo/Idh/MocA family oxidoreductase [Candidatus Aureabacteria bacterium]|nr:Gfo/Idh/MocA family oxidoreductase [Candidatus Auribacterota bacterium]